MQVGRDELVTGAEAARRLGISRERVRQLAQRDDFPEPVGRLGSYTVWRWRDVERWAKREGRL
jgi:predicted DNA-binding transcriptional regulator AlpA